MVMRLIVKISIIIGVAFLGLQVIGLFLPDDKYQRYDIEPDKSLRKGIEDCIVEEEDNEIAFLDVCFQEHFHELFSKTPENGTCLGTIKNENHDLIWLPKTCVFN